MGFTYYIDTNLGRELRSLSDHHGGAGLSAIDRLECFCGTEADVETAARLFDDQDQQNRADELRRGCYGPGWDAR